LVSDKDGATVAAKNRDPVPLKETADAAFPVPTGVTQLLRNHSFGTILAVFCKSTAHLREVNRLD
jgi:hypothetical protein